MPDLNKRALIPLPPDPCVGREKEMEQLVEALTSDPPRSAIVYGTSMVGKTGLCTSVCEHPRILNKYDMDRYYIDLRTAHTARQMRELIADGLRLPATDKIYDGIAAFMEQQPTLLILDNFETPWHTDEQECIRLLHSIVDTNVSVFLLSMRGMTVPQIDEADTLRLGPLTPDDVRNLFFSLTGFSEANFQGEIYELDRLLQKATAGLPFWVRLSARAARVAHDAITAEGRPGTKCALLAKTLIHRDGSDGNAAFASAMQHPLLEEHSKRLLALLGCVPGGLAMQDVLTIGSLLENFDGEIARGRLLESGLAETSVDDVRIILLPLFWEYIRTRHLPSLGDLAGLCGYFLALACAGNEIDRGALGELLFKLRIEFDNIAEVLLTVFDNGIPSEMLQDRFREAQKLIRPDVGAVHLEAPDEIPILAAAALARFQQFTGYAGSFLRNTEPLAAALQRAEDLKKPLRVAECHRLFGVLRSSEGEFDEALLRYGQARDVYEMLSGYEKMVGIAHCIRNMASTEVERNEYELARDGLEEAVALYHEVEQMGYDEKLPSIGYGGTIYRKEEIVKGLAVCQERLAHLDKAEQNLESAGQQYHVALKNFELIGDMLGQATCHKGFADLYSESQISDLRASSERYKRARELFREVGYARGEADCAYSRGDLALKLAAKSAEVHDHNTANERCAKALRLYDVAKQKYDSLKNRHGIANCLVSIVDAQLAMNVLDEKSIETSETDIETALKVYQETQANDQVGFANCHQALADIFRVKGNENKVREHERAAKEHWSTAFSPMTDEEMHDRTSLSPIGAMTYRWRK